VSPRDAATLLSRVTALPGHHFWSDDVAPTGGPTFQSLSLVGHRQVTDAYLIALAVRHRGVVATFDRRLRELLSERTEQRRRVLVLE
jgi:uncharacterized protein